VSTPTPPRVPPRAPPHVVVLGGGTAGWITACLLHHEWGSQGGTVTVVESPEIGIIGVGEGSTPQLKAFFDHLGIAEGEWMAACDATYKLGIRFTGWSERAGCESYFHPFPGPVDLHTEPQFLHNCALRRRGVDVPAHPDDWFLAQTLAESRKAPQPNGNFPFTPSYGYHFDALKLGGFLREWAVARGVAHRPLRVVDVALDVAGDVAALLCEGGERITGDIFVDCSGFRSLISQQKLGTRFLPFAENLFNDRAVVLPTAHREAVKPQTDSIAMAAGWRWSIPLTSRVGNGYVYSSEYISDEEAETELRAAIGMENEGEARFLQMRVGRVEDSWARNCLAVGLSQGFIEPLEATALHIVIATALDFAEAYQTGGFGPRHRDGFNRRIAAKYEGIRDYIVAHYRLNQRSDTQYWRDNAANHALSDKLKAMMTAWFTRDDIGQLNLQQHAGNPHYATMSWHCLFAGYGTFPPQAKMQPPPPGLAVGEQEQVRAMLAACAANFPDYRPV
jgi:glycine/D-amino acid oxidase-like deaminating enzyme